jgi:AAHS family 4-hydroxybenzoate transporter-like MFS transporter
MPNATAIAAEYTPPKKRALAVTLTIVCIPLGGLVAGLISRTILPDMGWRALFFVAGGMPLVVALILFLALPESPSFQADAPARQKAKLSDLFGPGIVRDTLSLWSAFFACLLATYAVLSWAPTMLTEAGYSPAVASDGLTAFNFGGIGGAVLAAWFIMAIGSRWSLMTLSGVAAIVSAISAIWVVGSGDATRAVMAFGILGFAMNGVQTTLFAVAAHVYPDAIRATGVGAALGIGRIGAVLSAFLGAIALSNGGGSGYFALIAVAMAVTLLALAMLSRHIPRSAEL